MCGPHEEYGFYKMQVSDSSMCYLFLCGLLLRDFPFPYYCIMHCGKGFSRFQSVMLWLIPVKASSVARSSPETLSGTIGDRRINWMVIT